jgi:hypothetical protein
VTLTLTLAPDVEGFRQAPCGCQLARQSGERSKTAFVVFTACEKHNAVDDLLELLTKILGLRNAGVRDALAFTETVEQARLLVDRLSKKG